MNRKHNPWVALVALLLLVTLLVVMLTGCAGCAEASEETPERFTLEMTQEMTRSVVDDIDSLFIILDTETGVRYLFADGYHGVGITPLLPGEEDIT